MLRFLALLLIAATFSVAICDSDDLKLQHPSILLPSISDGTVTFRTKATSDEGCIKWTPYSHKMKIESKCEKATDGTWESMATIFSSIFVKEREKFDVCLSLDGHAGGCVRMVEVDVAPVAVIEMATTARRLYVEFTQRLTVEGRDKAVNGDTFSTLDGLPFDWKTKSIEFSDNSTVMTIKPYEDPNSSHHHHVSAGSTQAVVVAKGENCGTAEITVALTDPAYPPGITTSVQFDVRDKLQISPEQPLYVMPGSLVQYELTIKKRDSKHDEKQKFPSSRFEWESTNEQVAVVDRATGVATALQPGETTIRAVDKAFSRNEATMKLYVVELGAIRVTWSQADKPSYEGYETLCGPQTNGGQQSAVPTCAWDTSNFVAEHSYSAKVEFVPSQPAMDTIYFAKNVRVTVASDSSILSVTGLTHHNWHANFTALALSTGHASIRVELNKMPVPPKVPTTVTHAATIHPPVSVRLSESHPSQTDQHIVLRLPFDPTISHTYPLDPSGGSSVFMWTTLAKGVASVGQSGIVTGLTSGKTMVVVADKRNPHNGANLLVEVSVPDRIEYLIGRVEVPIGQTITLTVRFHDKSGHVYTNASLLPVSWSVQSAATFTALPPLLNTSHTRTFRAAQAGLTSVEASYRNSIVKRTQPIGAFEPLRVADHADGYPVLLGSTVNVKVVGGPLLWTLPTINSTQQETVSGFQSSLISVDRARLVGPQVRILPVSCINSGENVIDLKVTNVFSLAGVPPSESSTTIRVACAAPVSAAIAALAPSDPITQGVADSAVQTKDRPFLALAKTGRQSFRLVLMDGKGRPFQSTASVLIQWATSNPDVAEFEDKASESTDMRFVRFRNPGGSVLKAEVTKYRPNAIVANSAAAAFGTITATLNLRSTGGILITPIADPAQGSVQLEGGDVFVWRQSTHGVVLRAQGGTNSFAFSTNDANGNVAKMSVLDQTSIALVPTGEGVVEVTAKDRTFPDTLSATALVRVSDVHHIKAVGSSRHVVQGDSVLEITATALDYTSRPFHPTLYMKLGLRVVCATSDCIISESAVDPANPTVIRVRGSGAAGMHILHVVAQRADGKTVRSNAIEVDFFRPIRVEPSEVHVRPGQLLPLTFADGPTGSDIEVQWRVEDKWAAVTKTLSDGAWAVEGMRPSTTSRITVLAVDKSNAVISQATAPLIVSELFGLGINMPSLTIHTGSHAACVHVVGKQKSGDQKVLQPSEFASNDFSSFSWTVDSSKVHLIAPITGQDVTSQVSRPAVGAVAVCLMADEASTATLTATFHYRSQHHSYTRTTSTQARFISPLLKGEAPALVMPPNSHIDIPLARHNSQPVYELIGDGRHTLLSLDTPNGRLRSLSLPTSSPSDNINDSEAPHVLVAHDRRHGDSSLVRVAVRKPFFVSLDSGSSAFSGQQGVLAVGMQREVTLSVSLLDAFGTQFATTQGTQIAITSSRPDVLRVSSSATQQGDPSHLRVVLSPLAAGPSILTFTASPGSAMLEIQVSVTAHKEAVASTPVPSPPKPKDTKPQQGVPTRKPVTTPAPIKPTPPPSQPTCSLPFCMSPSVFLTTLIVAVLGLVWLFMTKSGRGSGQGSAGPIVSPPDEFDLRENTY